MSYGIGNLGGKVLGPAGLAVIMGAGYIIKPAAPNLVMLGPAFVYFASWCILGVIGFWAFGPETHRDHSTWHDSNGNSSTGSACRRRSACGTARPVFSTCLPAAVMPLAITPICGRKCWTPTVLPPLPRPAMFSIRRSRNASKIIYSAGDTRDPMELYRAFRGREPTIEASLEQRGLTAA